MNILGKSVVAYYFNINFASSSFSFRSKSNKGNVRTSNDARLCVCVLCIRSIHIWLVIEAPFIDEHENKLCRFHSRCGSKISIRWQRMMYYRLLTEVDRERERVECRRCTKSLMFCGSKAFVSFRLLFIYLFIQIHGLPHAHHRRTWSGNWY